MGLCPLKDPSITRHVQLVRHRSSQVSCILIVQSADIFVLPSAILVSLAGEEVKCFLPSHFDALQIQFAQRACAAYIWDAESRLTYDNTHLPQPGDVEELQERVLQKANVSAPMQLYFWFIVEVVVIFAAYVITRLVTLCLSSAELLIHHVIASAMRAQPRVKQGIREGEVDTVQELDEDPLSDTTRSTLTQLKSSRLIFIVYIIVEIVFLLIWFGLSVNAVVVQSQRSSLANAETSNVMCEFNLSKLGNNQKYVTQCQMPLMHDLHMVAMANAALCFTVAILLLIHIVHLALVAPFLAKGPMEPILNLEFEKSRSTFFSDLTLLAMLIERPFH